MNRERGEVGLADGETIWRLRFSLNALCELEAATGKGVAEIGAELEAVSRDPLRLRIGILRGLFYAALTDRHPDMTPRKAGELLERLGAADVMPKVMRAFQAMQPTAGGAGPENPPSGAPA